MCIGTSTQAAQIFSDGFETQNFSTTNGDGFAWDSPNRTSVVTGGPGANSQVYPSLVVVNDSRDWTAKTGSYSMRFRYLAGESMTEQRFDLGGQYPDLWVSYWIRVPTNFTRPAGTYNNKWFVIGWGASMSDYETDGVRVAVRDWDGGSGNADISFELRQPSGYSYNNSGTYSDFVTPADAGRWMHCVYELKSGDGTGYVKFYRKWANESSYTLINQATNAVIKTAGNGATGWGYGYLMGYASDPYASDTEWLLDDFTTSTTDLREGGETDSTAPTTTISTSDPSSISSDNLTVTGAASDAVGVSGCKWRKTSAPDANNGTACTGTTSFSCSTSGYSSGSNTLYVGCYDAAGNYGSDSITVNYTPSNTGGKMLGGGVISSGGYMR